MTWYFCDYTDLLGLHRLFDDARISVQSVLNRWNPMLKLYFGCLFASWLCLKVPFFAKAKHFGGNISRERADLTIIFLHGFVKIFTCNGYPVFGTFQLGL